MKWFEIMLAAFFALALAFIPPAGRANDMKDKGKGKPKAPKSLTLDLGKGVKMKLVLVPAGKFLMGSKFSPAETARRFGLKAARCADEHPRHEVTISKPFYMGVCEVTQAQWRAVMGTETWKGKVMSKAGDNNAASWMTWTEMNQFCRKLSKKTGRKVALPTEAQWEYACRAGSKTVFCFGDDPAKLGDYAWYRTNVWESGKRYARPVGQKKPNAWGLYDMYGNVWEYCRDWYDPKFYANEKKVDPENTKETKHCAVRGGSWYNGSNLCRSAARNSWTGSNYRHYNYGFRVMVVSGSGAK